MTTTHSVSSDVIQRFRRDLSGQDSATLTVKFECLPTKFIYNGGVTWDERNDLHSLHGLTFVACNLDQAEPADFPAVSMELNLDLAADLAICETPGGYTVRWSGANVRCELSIDVPAIE